MNPTTFTDNNINNAVHNPPQSTPIRSHTPSLSERPHDKES